MTNNFRVRQKQRVKNIHQYSQINNSRNEEYVNHWTESRLYVIITGLRGKNKTVRMPDVIW